MTTKMITFIAILTHNLGKINMDLDFLVQDQTKWSTINKTIQIIQNLTNS